MHYTGRERKKAEAFRRFPYCTFPGRMVKRKEPENSQLRSKKIKNLQKETESAVNRSAGIPYSGAHKVDSARFTRRFYSGNGKGRAPYGARPFLYGKTDFGLRESATESYRTDFFIRFSDSQNKIPAGKAGIESYLQKSGVVHFFADKTHIFSSPLSRKS